MGGYLGKQQEATVIPYDSANPVNNHGIKKNDWMKAYTILIRPIKGQNIDTSDHTNFLMDKMVMLANLKDNNKYKLPLHSSKDGSKNGNQETAVYYAKFIETLYKMGGGEESVKAAVEKMERKEENEREFIKLVKKGNPVVLGELGELVSRSHGKIKISRDFGQRVKRTKRAKKRNHNHKSRANTKQKKHANTKHKRKSRN